MLNISTASHYPILRSRILLYIIAIIAFFNVFVLAGYGDYIYVLLFVVLAYLTSFYTKNMTVILCISMGLTNVLRFGAKATLKEGLDTMGSSAASEEKESSEEKETKESAPVTKAPAGGVTKNNLMDKLSSVMGKGVGKEDMANLQKRTDELMGMQEKLMQNMNTLEPLLNKAEGFLNKYEDMKSKVEAMREMKEGLQNMKKEVGGMVNNKEAFTNYGGKTGGNSGIRW